MEYGTILGIDKRASRIAQGTVGIGSDDVDGSFALLDGVFEGGCNMFDTAHLYAHGDNERTVGRWVNTRGVRREVIIIAKGAHHSRERRRVTPEDITSDLTVSLERFAFEYIDLYLLHRDDPDVPVAPIVQVLDEHARAGRIRAYGASNWAHLRIAEANEYAEANGLRKFVASSPQFSLAVPTRAIWGGCTSMSGPAAGQEREWYRQNKMAVITWSSMALGFMAGRFTQGSADSPLGEFMRRAVGAFISKDNFERLDRAEQLAGQMSVTVTQIALAYILNQPLNIFPLVGCRTVEEFQDNLGALDVKLTQGQIAWLELQSETP